MLMFNFDSHNQTHFAYSLISKRLEYSVVKLHFFNGEAEDCSHFSLKICNLDMYTWHLAGFMDKVCNGTWLLQPGSGSYAQICACPSRKLELQVAKNVPIKRGF